MRRPISPFAVAGALALAAVPCGAQTAPPGFGPDPELPAPAKSLLPTVNIAGAIGWPAGKTPRRPPASRSRRSPPGSTIRAGSTCCQTATCWWPRPTRRRDRRRQRPQGLGDEAGAEGAGAGVPSADRITLLRDADGDGVAETRTVFLHGLHSPFGMALVGDDFYVANTDAVVRFPYQPGATQITAPGAKVADLPAGADQPSLDQEPDRQPGRHQALRDRRLQQQRRRERHRQGDGPRGDPRDRSARAASRACSPRACAIPTAWRGSRRRGALWTVVNERDELGNDLVPDYITSVKDGAFYGWPYSYYGAARRQRVEAAAARSRRQGDRARLRARRAHGVARACASTTRKAAAGAVRGRRLHRPARVVEPGAAQRLQGDLRAVPGRQAIGPAGGHADRLPRRRRQCARPAGRRRGRHARARCWWRTTWATRSGAWARRPKPDRWASSPGRPADGAKEGAARARPCRVFVSCVKSNCQTLVERAAFRTQAQAPSPGSTACR